MPNFFYILLHQFECNVLYKTWVLRKAAQDLPQKNRDENVRWMMGKKRVEKIRNEEIRRWIHHRLQKTRVRLAWNKWREVTGVICDKKVLVKLKHKIYKTVIKPTMTYGAEYWTMKNNEMLMNKTEMRILLLLLVAPTWSWGRCGRHNSDPASSVMGFIFRHSDGSHVSVDTVHPSLLRSSSLSSPGWCHLQSLSSYVVLISPL